MPDLTEIIFGSQGRADLRPSSPSLYVGAGGNLPGQVYASELSRRQQAYAQQAAAQQLLQQQSREDEGAKGAIQPLSLPAPYRSGTAPTQPKKTEKDVAYTKGLATWAEGWNKVIGEKATQAYKAMKELPMPIGGYGNIAIGFGSSLASVPAGIMSIPVAAEWAIAQPEAVPGKAVDIAKNIVSGMYERELESPGSAIGSILGMYVGGKIVGKGMSYASKPIGAAVKSYREVLPTASEFWSGITKAPKTPEPFMWAPGVPEVLLYQPKHTIFAPRTVPKIDWATKLAQEPILKPKLLALATPEPAPRSITPYFPVVTLLQPQTTPLGLVTITKPPQKQITETPQITKSLQRTVLVTELLTKTPQEQITTTDYQKPQMFFTTTSTKTSQNREETIKKPPSVPIISLTGVTSELFNRSLKWKDKEEEEKKRMLRRQREYPSHWEYGAGLYPTEATEFIFGRGNAPQQRKNAAYRKQSSVPRSIVMETLKKSTAQHGKTRSITSQLSSGLIKWRK